jgi:hypothetical protein
MDSDADALPRVDIKLMAENVNGIRTAKGAASGIAELDSGGKVPSAQLPAMNYLPISGGTLTGILIAQCSSGAMANAAWSRSYLEAKGAGGVSDAAYMTFHRPNQYAVYFGLDSDNNMKYGGWSLGAATRTFYHTGNFDPTAKANLASPTFTGTVTVADLVIASTANYLRFNDTNAGQSRYIHHNDGYIGFLTSGGGWNFALHDNGSVMDGTPFKTWLDTWYSRKDRAFDWELVYSAVNAASINLPANWGHGVYLVQCNPIFGGSKYIIITGNSAAPTNWDISYALASDYTYGPGGSPTQNIWKLKKT